jgi:hypothetical protein
MFEALYISTGPFGTSLRLPWRPQISAFLCQTVLLQTNDMSMPVQLVFFNYRYQLRIRFTHVVLFRCAVHQPVWTCRSPQKPQFDHLQSFVLLVSAQHSDPCRLRLACIRPDDQLTASAGFLLRLLFCPEDGSDMFIRHFELSPMYTALQPRRLQSCPHYVRCNYIAFMSYLRTSPWYVASIYLIWKEKFADWTISIASFLSANFRLLHQYKY